MQNATHDFSAISDDTVKSIFEKSTRSRIYQRSAAGCSIRQLKQRRAMWKDRGVIAVFTAGVFDLLHTSHLLALTHYRLIGAREFWLRKGINSPSEMQLHEIAASDNVSLVLSVDSDRRVAADKAFVAGKGDCPKPLVSWPNRALLLARQQITTPDGAARPLVDFITMHGVGSCSCDDCPHMDNAFIASEIAPDIVVVSSGSPGTIQKLEEKAASLKDTKLVVIEENKLAYEDALLGGPIKTTAIIRRAQATT